MVGNWLRMGDRLPLQLGQEQDADLLVRSFAFADQRQAAMRIDAGDIDFVIGAPLPTDPHVIQGRRFRLKLLGVDVLVAGNDVVRQALHSPGQAQSGVADANAKATIIFFKLPATDERPRPCCSSG